MSNHRIMPLFFSMPTRKIFLLVKKVLVVMALLLQVKNFSQVKFPADKNASNKTVTLYRSLSTLLNKGILFGHEDDLAYGMGWEYENGRSDVKTITGDYPAVYGFDLGHIELNSLYNLDSVPFERMKQYIQTIYKRGGIITISWHANNPFNGKSAWNIHSNTVSSILPGGNNHQLYQQWLHSVAVFFKSLKTASSEQIPILFRPYHECTGNWFWWGSMACSDEEFKRLWQFTFQYLTNEEQVHNLLWVYNTADFNSAKEFAQRYPGNEYVDIVSFDAYQNGPPKSSKKEFIKYTKEKLSILMNFAKNSYKIPALAEVGYERIRDETWWTNTLYETIKDFQLSYILLWRNGGLKKSENTPWQFEPSDSYFTPTNANISANDFKQFKNFDKIIFQQKLTLQHIYQ